MAGKKPRPVRDIVSWKKVVHHLAGTSCTTSCRMPGGKWKGFHSLRQLSQRLCSRSQFLSDCPQDLPPWMSAYPRAHCAGRTRVGSRSRSEAAARMMRKAAPDPRNRICPPCAANSGPPRKPPAAFPNPQTRAEKRPWVVVRNPGGACLSA